MPAPRPQPARWTFSASTLAELADHRAYLDAEMAALRATPLARRRGLLVAMLVDAYVDRLFAAGGRGDDILEFRAGVARDDAALRLILALGSAKGDVVVTTEAVPVALADYGKLSVADFMVSLYNDHSVQRLLLIDAHGQRHDLLDTLESAVTGLNRVQARQVAGQGGETET